MTDKVKINRLATGVEEHHGRALPSFSESGNEAITFDP